MYYEFLIGSRYTRSRKRVHGKNRLISFISLVSILGTALGIAALIVVLSVMNGFQEELRTRILGVASHIQIFGYDNQLPQWQQVADQAMKHPDVLAAAPYIEQQSMMSFDREVKGALIRGILPVDEEKVADFSHYMLQGSLDKLYPGSFGIVLGSDLARLLKVGMYDKITLIAPQGLVTPAAVLPRVKQFTVVGIFNVGMYEYDSALALMHLGDSQTLYQMGDNVTGVRLKVDNIFSAPRIARELATMISAPALLSDWSRSHANFFHAVALEKTMMAVILFLIVIVATFNTVSSLVMTVQEKLADIAILRTLGATPRSIMVIFMLQGAFIGLLGLCSGILLGWLLAGNLNTVVAFLETLTGITLWNKEIYFVSELPSRVLISDIAMIACISLLLTLISTLYPSWRASRTNPAEALRYE